MKFSCIFLWILLVLPGCLVRNYGYRTYYPGDPSHEKGWSIITEKEYWMDVDVVDNYLHIFILTRFNAPHIITDTVKTIYFKRFVPYFDNGDTLKQDTTQGDFVFISTKSTAVTKNKDIHLAVIYEQDSAGIRSMHERKYELRLKRFYHLAVH